MIILIIAVSTRPTTHANMITWQWARPHLQQLRKLQHQLYLWLPRRPCSRGSRGSRSCRDRSSRSSRRSRSSRSWNSITSATVVANWIITSASGQKIRSTCTMRFQGSTHASAFSTPLACLRVRTLSILFVSNPHVRGGMTRRVTSSCTMCVALVAVNFS